MSTFPLCTYLHDDGHPCRSAAVRGRQFCLYHLRHRGRLMRMAQSRALNQRFQLFLPPPEDPAAIHSSITQVLEALAADVIEPSRARALISGLRLCLQNLKRKKADTWHDSIYHSDQPVEYESFEADYGLPKDLDLTRSPEALFPPASAASPGHSSDHRQLTTDNCLVGSDNRQLTTDNSLAAEAQHILDVSRGLPSSPEDILRFGMCVTPLDAELTEATRNQGHAAAEKILTQHERNEKRRVHRRRSSSDRERYALISIQSNLQAAIQRHAARLAAAQPGPETAKKPPTPATEKTELTPTGSIG